MEWIRKYHIAIAWMIATSAMLISLFFSEWMKLPPCDLCPVPKNGHVSISINIGDRNV